MVSPWNMLFWFPASALITAIYGLTYASCIGDHSHPKQQSDLGICMLHTCTELNMFHRLRELCGSGFRQLWIVQPQWKKSVSIVLSHSSNGKGSWNDAAQIQLSLGIKVSSLTRVAQELPIDLKWDQYSWIHVCGMANPTLTKCCRIWWGRNIGKDLRTVDPSSFGDSTSHSTFTGSSQGCRVHMCALPACTCQHMLTLKRIFISWHLHVAHHSDMTCILHVNQENK